MHRISLWAMVLFYFAAGAMHFLRPTVYIPLMPSYLPWRLPLIYISGAFEVLFALMLINLSTRRFASMLIIALLVAIFPANIHMAFSFLQHADPYTWLAFLRLPLQFLLIWWAWKVGHQQNQKEILGSHIKT